MARAGGGQAATMELPKPRARARRASPKSAALPSPNDILRGLDWSTLNELRKAMGLPSKGTGRTPSKTLLAQLRSRLNRFPIGRPRLLELARSAGTIKLLRHTLPSEARMQLRGLRGDALFEQVVQEWIQLWRKLQESKKNKDFKDFKLSNKTKKTKKTLKTLKSKKRSSGGRGASAAQAKRRTRRRTSRRLSSEVDLSAPELDAGPELPRIQHTVDNKWGLVDKIADGGEGQAWIACDLEERARPLRYVVKIAGNNPKGIVNELAIALPLEHPNIVRILRFGYVSGALGRELPYIVMERHGRSVNEYISEGRLTMDVVRSVLEQMSSALDYAHRNQVLHSDVNPGNILLDEAGTAKLCDFGLSRTSTPRQGASRYSLVTVSKKGHHPYYSAPEQLRDNQDEVHRQSDQYSLALVALAMLRGEHIDKPDQRFRILSRLTLPATARAALKRALADHWSDRYESCAEFLKAFLGVATGRMRRPRRKQA
jgi:serine/threonine protein kinase